jgi:hypothetical protein
LKIDWGNKNLAIDISILFHFKKIIDPIFK